MSWLMAYRDGELRGEAREQVETWLANHPEALQWLAAEDQLLRLMEETRPAEPEHESWARTLAVIGSRISAAPMGATPRSWRLAAGLSAVAALLMVGLLTVLWSHRDTTPLSDGASTLGTESYTDMTPLRVAGAADINIISMDGGDVPALVVGRPPVDGPLILAAAGDVKIDRMEPHADGTIPDFHQPSRGAPMVIGPLLPAWGGD